MKKNVMLVLVICMLATVAFAEGETATETATETKSSTIGARAGYSFSPDQFFIGAHMDLGQVVGPTRLVPNIEFGFGNDMTLICFNGDFIYDFEGTPWGVGGELGLIYSSYDVPGLDDSFSDTNLGMSLLGDYRLVLGNGKTLLLEAKVGLIDSPDFKLTVGYDLF